LPKITRKKTRKIYLGGVPVGGDAPITVQSMTNTDTRDIKATVRQIKLLEEAGCEIIRIAVPDQEAVKAIPEIKKKINLPLIADIHFNYQLALNAMKNGVDGIRINPGNLTREKIREVVKMAKERDVVIRIGVNAGSLQKELALQYGGVNAESLVASALKNIELLEEEGFSRIKLSLKSSDVPMMIEAYLRIAEQTEYPLHLGVTEAGTLIDSAVKSAMGIGTLLYQGIGDTIRVSVTGNPVLEIPIAYGILRSLKIRQVGPEIVSCPTCGRCQIDLAGLVAKVEKGLAGRKEYLKVALMGCVVNGPGEAADADIGIAGGKSFGMLFKKGIAAKKIKEKDFVPILMQEINAMLQEKKEE